MPEVAKVREHRPAIPEDTGDSTRVERRCRRLVGIGFDEQDEDTADCGQPRCRQQHARRFADPADGPQEVWHRGADGECPDQHADGEPPAGAGPPRHGSYLRT